MTSVQSVERILLVCGWLSDHSAAEVYTEVFDSMESCADSCMSMLQLLPCLLYMLYEQATQFKKQGGEIKNKMWWENMRVKAVVIAIILILILIIVLSVCHGFNCT